MSVSFKEEISNDFASLAKLMSDAEVFLEKNAVDSQASYRINLALEEMLTNTVKYGYDDPGRHKISVSLEIQSGEVVLVIEDDGHEFNPLLQRKKDPAAALEEREIGGLGINLIKKLLDRVEYRREQGRNILEIRTRRQSTPTIGSD